MGSSDQDGGLPIADYDHLPVSSLQHRIRTLDVAGLERLLDYEREHADRPQMTEALNRRAEELRGGATPSGGDANAPAPEGSHAPGHREQVSPRTSGPAVNPPSQGVPTNPAQPRSTG